MPENTTARDPLLHLLGSMSDGPEKYITDMEADGQRQVVASQDLPTKLNGGTEEEYVALGFTFGDPYPRDRMFRPATLPEGWKREGSDHSMWSYIVDRHGRRRVAIFYKAAFYDRDAFMSLETRYSYLRSVLYDGGHPVLDDEWLPAHAADEELARIRDARLKEAAEAHVLAGQTNREYWVERAAEHRAEAAKAEAMRAKLAVAP